MSADAREPIAIVGIGCRLPGGANDPSSLWRLLRDGIDAITPIPDGRFDVAALYDERPATPGHIMSRWGGFVDGIDLLDAAFFEIAPRQAERLDPQHRLLLETSWEALEDAGLSRRSIAGTNAGVYVGMWTNEYDARMFADTERINFHTTTGTGRYAASGRLSFFYDVLGPSVTIDTACSSSLVAIHLACQGLLGGECDVAIAGGVNVIVEPFITLAYSQSRMMAADGRCKFGDAAADGYVRSDGAVMVALKRLAVAEADGDHVYAVIRGSAVTNDGRTSGLLGRPGQSGQEAMLHRAYANAGVDPQTVQYVEAHGTGTAAGDPVEVGALGTVVGIGRDEPLLVGSIKSNIGHTEGAAGAAGLVKLALALEHGEIPATLHCERPNPLIDWAALGVRLNDQHRPWPNVDGPRRAGVSAYGIAGTNAHIVLEQAPTRQSSRPLANRRSPFVLPVSAVGTAALRARATAYAQTLTGDDAPVAELCATAATRRTHHADRLAVVGTDETALADALRERADALAEGEPRTTAVDTPKVVFVFAGQGSQWAGMARELLAAEPVFAAAMTECDAAIRVEAGWSPLLMLAIGGELSGRLDDIDVVQPLLFSVQVSLAALWRSWGIVADAVVGHSMGEVAAANVAGALDLTDAVAVICRRSALLRRISGQGAMALVDLALAETAAVLVGHEATLSIAVSNSPRSTVVSGDPDALQQVLAELQAQDVFCRAVNVDVASHSPQVDPLLDELRAGLAEISPRGGSIPFRSTVDGETSDGSTLDAAYWAANLRRPVMFGDAVAELAANGSAVFVELSPHPILLPSIDQVGRAVEHEVSALASMRRGEGEVATMLAALAALYEAGVDVDWPAVTGVPAQHVVLPTYPWQRERFWYESAPARRSGSAAGDHPLLGSSVRLAEDADAHAVHWQTTLDGDDLAFLHGHVVLGSAVLPATGFVELARVAATVDSQEPVAITNVALHEALLIDPARPRDVQVSLDGPRSAGARCRIWSRDARTDDDWLLHAELGVGNATGSGPDSQRTESIDAIVGRCGSHRSGDEHRESMRSRGLEYSGSFACVGETWAGDGEALGRIDTTAGVGRAGSTECNIAMLDGCVQIALVALPTSTAGQTFVPVAVGHISIGSVDDAMWSHAVFAMAEDGTFHGTVTVFDVGGDVVAELGGLELRRVGESARQLAPLLYGVEWRTMTLDDTDTDTDTGRDGNGHDADATIDTGRWIVYASSNVGNDLVARRRADGHECVVVRPGPQFRCVDATEYEVDPTSAEDHRRLLADVDAGSRQRTTGVVYGWAASVGDDIAAADTATADTAGDDETLCCLAPIAIVQALGTLDHPPRLWLVTRGAHEAVPEQALLWGLGRVVANEQPALRCTLVDLDPATTGDGDLFDEMRVATADRQVSYRDGGRTVARVEHVAISRRAAPRTAPADSYRIAVTEPGLLDSVRAVAQARRVPAAGEVELRVTAAALNFLDVLKASGIYPGLAPSPAVALGAECAGVVVAVGSGVDHVAVGDQVVAITPSYDRVGMLASYVTVPAALVVARPPSLSAADAASAPVAYVTAFYALCELGRVRAGERVLVHAATGGVGLAALQICRLLGAEVFATAGSQDKRDHLRSLGVEHVFDSRTTAFADEIRAVTDGRGVDLVLNSLTGEAIAAGLSVLAPRGRFVEIGKRDVYAHRALDLGQFKHNIALFVVDLAGLTEQDPDDVGRLLRNVIAMLADGQLAPLPATVASIEAAADAFRNMARGTHIGKLVLTVPESPLAADAPAIGPDATYLVTGGTGGLGLAVAARLVDRGARHIALIARRPATGVADAVGSLRDRGADVRIVHADVGDATRLRVALDEIRATMPALRGVIHAAGVLADATVDTMDRDRFRDALAPKLHGARNLHLLTLDDPLDHFVLFSSVAATFGLTGQSNYAAGNAYLDALAARRRADGRPGVSIGWGPWSEIGLAASASNRGERLAARGLASIEPAEALDALDLVLDGDASRNVSVMRFDAGRWVQEHPSSLALLDDLLMSAPTIARVAGPGLRDRLLEVPGGPRRRRAMEDALCAELAPVLRVPVERVDRNQPLKAMGLDSLMALELRNRVELVTGLTLAATIAWNYPTVTIMAEHLATLMGVGLAADAPSAQSVPVVPAAPLAEVPAHAPTATQDDLEALLLEELAAVDRLLDVEGRSS